MFKVGSKRAKDIQEKEASEQGPPPWKKTIDDALLLFKYAEITTENGKMKSLTMNANDLEGVIKNQLINLCYRLCNELDQDNINKYRSYRDEYKEDTFDLWRKGEMFTPVLYLAKASPFGSVAMLKIMIAKGADLKLQASTVGCRILSFFCTSIAKLSLKNYTYYMIRIEGEFLYVKKYLAPKTLGVYDSLVKINKGDKVEFQYWEIEIFKRNNLEKEYNTRILALKNNIPYISSVQYTLPIKKLENSTIYGAGIALFFSSALIIGVISASAFIVLTPLSQPLRVLKLHKNQARIEFNNIIINSAKRSGLTQGKKDEIIQKLNTDICRQKDCYIIEAQKFVGVQQLDNLPSLPEITPEELTEMNKGVLAHAVQQAQEAATIARDAAKEVMYGGTTTPAATAATAAAAAANAAAVTAFTLAKSADGEVQETINKVNESVQQAEQAAAVAVTEATQMNTPTGASTTGGVTLTSDQFVPILDNVLTNTEKVTLSAIQSLKGQGIEKEVDKFENDVKRKIAETRARLNGLPANAVVPAAGLGAPATGAPANSTVVPTNKVPIVKIPPIEPLSSPSDNLNLLKVLNESLINTIQQVITQMGAGNTDSVRRMLGYIQILLIKLQKLVVVFNGLDNRMGRIENHFKIPRRLTNTSQPDLEALRKQLEELMKLPPPVPAPAPVVAPNSTGFFRTILTRGGYSRKLSKTKRKLRRKTPAKTRKRVGHKKASRKK
jgi:hypothetical protein